MNILIFPQYAFPCSHAVVNQVFEHGLPDRGHTVHMIRPKADARDVERLAAPWKQGSLTVFPDEPLGSPLYNMQRSRRVNRWVHKAIASYRSEPIDAMLVRNDLICGYAAAGEAERRGIPFGYQLSSPDAEFTMRAGREAGGWRGSYMRVRGRVGVLSRRRLMHRANVVLPITGALSQHLHTADGIPLDTMFAFPMGVVPDHSSEARVDELRRALNLPHGRTLVYSGVIDAIRQTGWILDAFEHVARAVPGAALLVMTYQDPADERRRAFEADAQRRGLNVRVIGPVPHADVAAHLRCADVACSPYPPMFEHFVSSPTKSLEAMNAGLPVVGSSEIDEHRVVFNASGGGIAVPWSLQPFADAVAALLRDPARRRQMGEAGQRWVRAHRTYGHLTEYLDRILSAAGQPGALQALPHEP